ncbi:MAG: DUF3667 domain-containing protein [Bacteroidales bacterium]|nr:DUF3667 domain-containing protein [Bacteroidales bacterium]
MAKSSVTEQPGSETTGSQNKDIKVINCCKNCEHKFEGKFCPNCGQSIKEFEKPFSFLIVDLAGNIFAFDTRFWKTFVSILIRPGHLASDYLKGHRARYMPPFRFYVFISFIFFVLLSIYVRKNIQIDDQTRQSILQSIDQQDSTFTNDSLPSKSDTLLIGLNNNTNGHLVINSPTDKSEQDILRSIKNMVNNPAIYFSKFLKFFSWSLFVLMPIYALLLWLFFHNKRRYYYGHLIFAINQHAFTFIVLTVLLLIIFMFPNREHNYQNYLLLLIPVYLFTGYLQFYKQKWPVTFFKWLGINFIYIFLLTLSIGVVFYIWFKSEFL